MTDIDEAAAGRVTEEIREAGGIAQPWRLDVADRKRIDAVIDQAAEQSAGFTS